MSLVGHILLRSSFHRHSLPESPPDSSSEHPYSPQDGNEPNMNQADNIYTTIGQNIYKPGMLNPIITENLILGSHIVVTEQNGDQQIIENSSLLQVNFFFGESSIDLFDIRLSTVSLLGRKSIAFCLRYKRNNKTYTEHTEFSNSFHRIS